MPSSVAELEARALELTPEERAELADRLLSSLGTDSEVESAWAVEIDRRLAEMESEEVHEVSIEDSLARARAAIR